MRYDFTPLYRSTVGFDRLFDAFDRLSENDATSGWPPYDIEKVADESYRISLVIAGYAENEVELVQKESELIISGQKQPRDGAAKYAHRGIPHNFKQSFSLADHMKVVDATLENGVLTISLRREIPEALKPRRIEITAAGSSKVLTQDSQARPEQIGGRGKAA
jgi:molecular chaperone IbpA